MNNRRRLLFAGLAVAALGLTGCGGDTDPTNAASSNEHDQVVKFAKCLRKHGVQVDIPDPGQGKVRFHRTTGPQHSAPGKDTMDAAMKACRKYAPAKLRKPPSVDPDHQLKFAKCLREHGIDAADPKPGEPITVHRPRGIDKKMKQAMKACEKQTGGPPGGIMVRKDG